ncbi:MAG: universal stress protein [Capsulimonadales bacterium]|nr:universal stress protein [Capsulimonadales bacterium]
MQTVLGVDGRCGDRVAAQLLRRLAFPHPDCDVVNVVESLPFPWWGAGEMSSPDVVEKLLEDQEERGAAIVSDASKLIASTSARVRTLVRRGGAADQLMSHADEINADLIAIAGSSHTNLGAFLTGSVGRSLVLGAKQSLLIAKGTADSSRPLRAVLATDHSRYMDECIELLARFAPQGAENITLLTAYPKSYTEAIRAFLPEFIRDPAAWIREGIERRSSEIAERLKPLGATVDFRVSDLNPNEAIKQVMEQKEADLLILGSRGHGGLERILLGSVAFHQVIGEPYSTLVLRAPIKERAPEPKQASEMPILI